MSTRRVRAVLNNVWITAAEETCPGQLTSQHTVCINLRVNPLGGRNSYFGAEFLRQLRRRAVDQRQQKD